MDKSYIELLGSAFGVWFAVPLKFWLILWPLTLMTLASYPLLMGFRVVRENLTSRLDRWFLAPLFAIALYKLLFTCLNAALRIPISAWSFYLVTALIAAAGWYLLIRSGVEWKGQWRRRDWLFLVGMLAILFLATFPRFANTVRLPDRLMNSDPYRHYPRTEWIVQTGYIAETEPWLTGEVPIYEAQGCYVFAAQLSRVTGCDSWTIWKYGSTFFGGWSALAMYLLAAYLIPGRIRRFAGLMAGGILATLVVHIWRTNMGFSEAWAMPLIPPAILMLIWAFRYHSFGAGVLYGLFYVGITLSNMIPSVYIVFFLVPFCLLLIAKRMTWDLYVARERDRYLEDLAAEESGGAESENDDEAASPAAAKGFWRGPHMRTWLSQQVRCLGGLAAGVAIFIVFVAIWSSTYALIPLYKGAGAHGRTTDERLESAISSYDRDKQRDYVRNQGSVEAGIQAEETRVRRAFGPFAYRAARYMGSFTDEIGLSYFADTLQTYIRWHNLQWGFYGLILLMLIPTGWPKRRDPAPITQPLRMVGGWPASQWFDTRVFLLCAFCIPLYQFANLDWLIEMGMPAFQSKVYRFLVYPGYILALTMALALDTVFHLVCETVRLVSGWLTMDRPTRTPAARADAPRAARRAAEKARSKRSRRRKSEPAARPAAPEPTVDEAPATAPIPVRLPRVDGVWLLRVAMMVVALFMVSDRMLRSVQYGWSPTSTAAEERALEWMSEHLPEDSKIFTNWFHADFVRSYTAQAGRPMDSIFTTLRTDVKQGKLSTSPTLAIPELLTVQEALEYARQNPGPNYYVFKGQYGPYWNLSNDRRFVEVGRFPGEKTAEIWALADNPVHVVPFESTDPIPIGGSELGEILYLNRIHDGTVGTNSDNDPAYSNDPNAPAGRLTRSHWAWFGLRLRQQTTIDGMRAYFGWHKDPTAIIRDGRGKSPLMYIPTEYVFQAMVNGQWQDIPGTHVTDNTEAYVVAEGFDPIEADAVRVYIHGQRNEAGTLGPGPYRAAVLEVDFRVHGEDWKPLQGL